MVWFLFGSFARRPGMARDIDLICDIEGTAEQAISLLPTATADDPFADIRPVLVSARDLDEPLKSILRQLEGVAMAIDLPVDVWFEPFEGLTPAGYYIRDKGWEIGQRYFGRDFGWDAEPIDLVALARCPR